jgi:hypothetical protein
MPSEIGDKDVFLLLLNKLFIGLQLLLNKLFIGQQASRQWEVERERERLLSERIIVPIISTISRLLPICLVPQGQKGALEQIHSYELT